MYVLITGLLFSVVILTLSGTGIPVFTGSTGLILCAMGLMQKEIRVDGRIFLPLVGYNLFSLLSSFITTGTPFQGYVYDHLICSLIFFLAGALDEKGRGSLRLGCMVWSAVIAVTGIVQFLWSAFREDAGRLGGIFKNANVTGSFLVFSWFALMQCRKEAEDKRIRILQDLIEPLILYGTALTLSMGSFVAMAAGILVMTVSRARRNERGDTMYFLLRVLAKASMGIGAGILLFIAAAETGQGWLMFLIVLYMLALAILWGRLELFLEEHRKMTVAIPTLGVLAAGSAVLLRTTSVATFAERIEMTGNGISYILGNSLFGVGPLKWHILNLSGEGKYFNTWYIHDLFIHVGTELGIPAMLLLLAAAVGVLMKKRSPELRAGTVALIIHYCLDVGFVYAGTAASAVMLLGVTESRKKTVNSFVAKAVLLGFMILFACGLFHYLF